ncbi:MAG: helix-turn-helix domain-containing protein [Planctomycetales bacterium]|jgi:predicted transcriptional regulator
MAKKRHSKAESGKTVRLKDGREILLPDGAKMDFAQTLRDTIRDAGLSQYRLSRESGVAQSALSTFMSGKDLRVETFQRLCHVVGLELAQNPDRAPRAVATDSD